VGGLGELSALGGLNAQRGPTGAVHFTEGRYETESAVTRNNASADVSIQQPLSRHGDDETVGSHCSSAIT